MSDNAGKLNSIEYYQDNGQYGDRPALKFFADILKRYCPEGAILDDSCGTGWFLEKFPADKYKKYGFDISADAVELAQEINPEATFPLDIEQSIPAGSLDCVSSLHTLEHIEHPQTTLKMFHKLLKPSGILFFVVPNSKSWGKKQKGEDWFAYGDPTHISLLTHEDWLLMTEETGFEIMETGVDGLWDVPYWKGVPEVLQKLIFYGSFAPQFLSRRLFLPDSMGEDLIVIASKR